MIVMRFFWPVFWFLSGALVAYAWISMRRRLRRSFEVPPPRIDQDDIRRIEEEGATRSIGVAANGTYGALRVTVVLAGSD